VAAVCRELHVAVAHTSRANLRWGDHGVDLKRSARCIPGRRRRCCFPQGSLVTEPPLQILDRSFGSGICLGVLVDECRTIPQCAGPTDSVGLTEFQTASSRNSSFGDPFASTGRGKVSKHSDANCKSAERQQAPKPHCSLPFQYFPRSSTRIMVICCPCRLSISSSRQRLRTIRILCNELFRVPGRCPAIGPPRAVTYRCPRRFPPIQSRGRYQ
jgi:hypothetical protein